MAAGPPGRRRAGRAALGLAVLGALAGCGLQEPTPFVTIYTDGSSEVTEASLWCFDEEGTVQPPPPDAPVTQDLADGECEAFDRPRTLLQVPSGTVVGFNVSKTIRDEGWRVGGDPTLQDDFTLQVPVTALQGPVPAQVLALRDEDPSRVRGVYEFCLVPEGTEPQDVPPDCVPETPEAGELPVPPESP